MPAIITDTPGADLAVLESGFGVPGDNAASGSVSTDTLDFQNLDGPVAGAYGTFFVTNNHDGTLNWTYVLDDVLADSLSDGEPQIDVLVVTADDGTPHSITVNVTGSNDGPVLSVVSLGAVFDSPVDDNFADNAGAVGSSDPDGDASPSYTLTAGGPDVSQAGYTMSQVGTYGTLYLAQATGNYKYVANDAAVEGLKAADTDTFSITVTDSHGATDVQNFTIDINGTNDGAVIGGVFLGSVTEDDAGMLVTGGALTVSDRDTVDVGFQVQNGTAATYGSFDLDAAGNWTYTADNSQVAIQQLAAGETLTDSFTAVSADGGTNQLVTVTITGTNDAPTLGAVAPESYTDTAGNDGFADIVGTLAGADADTSDVLTYDFVGSGADASNPPYDRSASTGYGTLYLNSASGDYRFVPDNAGIQGLTGPTAATFDFTVSDGTTSSAPSTLTINLNGAQDAPVIGGVSTGGVTEDDAATLTASGALTIADRDDLESAFQPQGSVAGDSGYGSFTLLADGSWTYSADNSQVAIQQLPVGQTLTDSFTALSVDGTPTLVTVTITGTNDDPVIIYNLGTLGTVTDTPADDVFADQVGQVTYTDIDAPETHTYTVAGGVVSAVHPGYDIEVVGTYGTLYMKSSDGNFIYTPDDAAVEGLKTSELDSFTVTVTDGAGGSDTRTFTVTVDGTNDVAAISGADTGTVMEDNVLTATGTLLVADLDSGDAELLPVVAGTAGTGGYGTFEVLADGSWTYTLDNADPAVQALPTGQTLTDTITVSSKDGTDTHVITITIDGDNDPATITGVVTGAVAEDGTLVATGTMIITDADTGEGELVAVAAGTAGDNGHGSFEVLANGQWTYTLNNADAAVQALPAGQTLTDTITVASKDGTDTQVVTVTITGTNDVPTLGGTVAGGVTEDAATPNLTASGALTVADVDTGESAYAVQNGTVGTGGYGLFNLAADGSWSYSAANAQSGIQQLAQGETVTDSFTAVSADGSASQVVTVTITGVNDNPEANDDTAATDEGVTVLIDVLANDGDIDNGAVLTVTTAFVAIGGGSVSIASDGSSITFDPGSDFAYLASGETATATIQYDVSDGQGGVATANAVVTVTGGNEAPVILPASETLASLNELADGNASENNFTHGVAGTIYFADGDTSDTHSASFVAQGGAYLGTFSLSPSVNQAGDSIGWSFSVSDAALNSLAQGAVLRQYYTVTVSDGQGGTVDQVVEVDLVGTNDRAVLSSAHIVVPQGNDPATASDALTISDEDSGEAVFVPQLSTAGLYGHFSVAANGAWSYVADQAYDLGVNQYLTDVFTVLAADGTPTTVAVTIAGVDQPAVGAQDLFTTAENQAFGAGFNLFADNGYGADMDPEGNLQISAVNGSTTAVGNVIQLASGALLTVNADGTFSYDPNHAFDSLTAASGAANQFSFDSFTYTLAGGSTTTAFVNVIGVNSAQDVLGGNGLDNAVTGFAGNDTFMLNQGGSDSASGLGGNDGFFFGGYFDSSDAVDGGEGTDTLALQGNTAANLGGVSDVEVILALSGSDTRFGDTLNQRYDYDLTTTDDTVGASRTLTVQATALLAGEDMTFNGSAETDGNFRIFAGRGVDDLTGGAGSDGFFFGADGNLTGADHVDGGAGVDTLALRGNYVGGNAVVFQNGSFTGVEVLSLLSGHTNEYSGVIVAGGYDYDVTTADGNVAAGQRLDVNGARLGVDETMMFNGSAETDGSFRILGGAADDTLTGGAQADTLYGGAGKDQLNGGAGGDVFFYRSAAESTSTGYDVITGFDYREDRLDMPGGGARAFGQAGSGNLSTASFDADLAAGLNGILGAGQAALFTASGGTLAGHVFAVVDANGVAGYQAGEDFVIELANPVVPIDPVAPIIG
jgi:VCBS repeat-containing protein